MSVYDTKEIGKVKIVMLAGSGGGGASTLTDLSDVNIESPTNGQGLIYNSALQKWINGNSGNTYTAGTGIGITNNTIFNTLPGARCGVIDSISSNYAHTEIITNTNETFKDGELIILRGATSGTAQALRIQYAAAAASVYDYNFYDTEGTAQSISVSANTVLVIQLNATFHRAIVLAEIDISGGGSSDAYALAGMGKEVSYSNQTITTDIELFRSPKVGDRFLIYFPDSCSNPQSLVINVNGTPTTLSWEIVGGDTYKGLCAIEVKAGMISALALKKIWLEDELSAGTGISIVNNIITNTAPQLGENVGDRTYTTAITDGDLGNVPLNNDYVILNFKAAAQPDSTTGKYTIMEAASSYHLYAALVDMAGNDYTAEIPAGTTLICKNKDGGDGTSADPYKITVLGIGSGGGGDELNDLSDVNISSPSNGQVLGYNSTSGKWENKTQEVYFDATATLSTSTTTTVTFTESEITTSSVIDIAVSEWGLTPEDVTVTTGVCTVTMPKVSTARSITVRIYVR